MPSRPRARLSTLSPARRALALVWLLVYVVSTVGIPLPTLAAGAGASTAVAACGCPSEAQGMGNCCCYKAQPSPAARSCCAKPKGDASHSGNPKAGAKSTRKVAVTVVLAIAARHCQGLSETWLSGDAALPLPLPGDSQAVQLAGAIALVAERFSVVFADPPIPPPRLGLALSIA